MRAVILMLVGALIGAAAFHFYYLRLDPAARCGWDHPIDAEARSTCRAATAANAHGYAAKARRDLDSLIGKIAH
jgi:hypothetical protein